MSSKKQILVYESGHGKGGSRRSLLNCLKLMSDWQDIELRILCGNRGWFTEQLDALQLSYEILQEPKSLNAIKNSILSQKLKVFYLSLRAIIELFQVWQYVLKIKTDAIFIAHPREFVMLLPLIIKRNRHTAVAVRSTDWGKVPLGKLTCQIANQIFVNSTAVANSIIELGIKPDKVKVLPLTFVTNKNGDQHQLQGKLRSQLGLSQDARILGVVGTIKESKGQLEAIEIFASLKEHTDKIYLVIIGGVYQDNSEDLEYIKQLRQRVVKLDLNDRIFFLGWREDVPTLMKDLDILLMPTMHSEGRPRVVLEALEAGVPIVSSNLSAITEILGQNEIGYQVLIEDKQSWIDAILSILNDRERQIEMSAKSLRVWKQNYSAATANIQLYNAFAQLVG